MPTPLYSTVSLALQQFPALGSATSINSATIAEYIGQTDSIINGYLARRYSLPLTVVPPMIQALSTREAVYSLVAQRGLVQFPPPQQGRHPMQQMHLDDLELLKGIGEGQITLTNSDGSLITLNTGMIPSHNNMDYVPTMDMGPVTLQRVDPQLLEDIQANKGITGFPFSNDE